jgi:hypothetical protein
MTRTLARTVLLAVLLAASVLQAQPGNIDPSQRHAWAENAGWLDFRPAFGGVTVLPTYLSGYAWSEAAGWVKLGADGSGPYVNDGTPGTWGVNLNSVTGVLSGFAWSESAGWIRMDPTFGGVTYDGLTHQLSGWAWSESHGWIHFRSTTPTAYGVAVTCGSLTGTVTGGGTVCTGNSSTVTVTVSGGAAPYSVTLDNGGGTQSGAGPAFTFTVTPASTTSYSVASLTDGLSCVGAGSGSATVTVNSTPATPTASSNSPVCTGSTINLSTPTVAGATYAWSGPNGFTSADQNPAIPGATAAMAGTYSVTLTGSGCVSGAGTTNVVVKELPPAPTASNGGAICAGGTISLTASAVAGATYAWTGPNGYTSSAQNPTIPNATVAMAGTYSVKATVNGCASAPGTTTVVVDPSPATPVLTAPLNVWPEQSFKVSVPAVAGVTYDWIVTNGTITAGSGTREITITAGTTGTVEVSVSETDEVSGCFSADGSVSMPIAFLATGYYAFAPCRLFDTRDSSGPTAAAPALAPGETRTLAIGTRCGIPTSTVRSLAVNQTVTAPTADGELVLFRGDLPATPIGSSISYRPGKTRANNAILELSWSGDGTIKVHNRSTGSVHFILDVSGAFW